VPADGNPRDFQPVRLKQTVTRSAALSMADTVKDTIKTRKVAILAADGVDEGALANLVRALTEAGAMPKIIAPRGGTLKGADGGHVKVDWSLLTVGSVLFDAVFVPGGAKSTEALGADGAAILFVREAYKHCKAVGGNGTGLAMLRSAGLDDAISAVPAFLKAIAQHRDWTREERAQKIPV
jgi:catalase